MTESKQHCDNCDGWHTGTRKMNQYGGIELMCDSCGNAMHE